MADNAEQTESQKAITASVPVLGGGSALTAVSTTMDGTTSTVMVVVGAVLIVIGAVLFGRALKMKKLEENEAAGQS